MAAAICPEDYIDFYGHFQGTCDGEGCGSQIP
jgi:hypothetical protein